MRNVECRMQSDRAYGLTPAEIEPMWQIAPASHTHPAALWLLTRRFGPATRMDSSLRFWKLTPRQRWLRQEARAAREAQRGAFAFV